MIRATKPILGAALGAAVLVLAGQALPPRARAEAADRVLPAPALVVAPASSGLQTAVFAGGCFWGVQAVFQHVTGVTQAISGYAGGAAPDPSYEQVSSGETGHPSRRRSTPGSRRTPCRPPRRRSP